MADVTTTPADVEVGLGRVFVNTVILGEAMDGGDVYYIDSSDSQKAKKADASALTTAAAQGIIVTPGSSHPIDTEVSVVTSGPINLGGTPGLTVGAPYYASANAGSIADSVATSDIVTLLGFATSAAEIDVSIKRTGISKGA